MTEGVEAIRAELLLIVRELMSATSICAIHGIARHFHDREAGERSIAELAALKAGARPKPQQRKRVNLAGNVVAFKGGRGAVS